VWVCFDRGVPGPLEMSRDELIALVGVQADRIAGQEARIAGQDVQIAGLDVQIASMAGQIAELLDANEALTAVNEDVAVKLARLEHLLSRNSSNSSSPSSKDDDPGRTPPPVKKKSGKPAVARGKQRGASGSNLAWSDTPDDRRDRFPEGTCGCGAELAGALDLGVVDRYQQVEVPLMTATRTQYEQHAVRCGCGKLHTATRPGGAAAGPVGYGPNLQAWAVYLLVVQFIPVQRCVQMLESLTGATPSAGFVQGMLSRAAALSDEVDKRIRTLITLAYAVCCDETPLRVGPKKPKPGRKKSEKYLLVACTELWTHYQLGDRDLATFTAFVVKDLTDSVVVHDRYQNYDSAELGTLVHQLCCAHLLRDLDGVGEVYPDAIWPKQIADALRGLIHETNLAREQHRPGIDDTVKAELLYRLRQGVLVGLSETTRNGNRPGERKARLLLEVFRDRPGDVLRFVDDLRVPPTSNQAERDLRPAKIQQKISGRLTSEQRTTDRYKILGYVSSAAKNGLDKMAVLRDAILGRPWIPDLPAPT
jgi:transposase